MERHAIFKNEVFVRSITGILLVGIVTASVLYSLYSFIALVLIINLLGLNEFYQLFTEFRPRTVPGILFSFLFFMITLLFAVGMFGAEFLVSIVPFAFALFVIELCTNSENPFLRLAITFLGVIYITVPCLLLATLAFIVPGDHNYNSAWIMGLFFLVWTNDTMAYVFGKLFGTTPLFKRVSPGKTWEGSIGGAAWTLGVAFLLSQSYKVIAPIHWIVIACIVICIGTLGDLVKSRMKRSLNIKDSGKILPGHGGILDRFDSLLSSAPFVLLYLVLVRV